MPEKVNPKINIYIHPKSLKSVLSFHETFKFTFNDPELT